jgi:aldehyde dehydrogenase (NAD(P)+)
MLILAKGWPQRDQFMSMVAKAFGQVAPRKAYYPGARERYTDLLRGHDRIEKFGQPSDGALAWALVRDVDASNRDEKLFQVEPFCGILSQTEISSNDPVAFLDEVTSFCNDRMWGTLNATIVIHPKSEADPAVARALDRATAALRYGSIGINHWPGLVYGFVTPPWGGHPSATLRDIQSGLGWVHNTYMLEGIEKSVLRGPLKTSMKPAWFFDNGKTRVIAEKLTAFEASPSWLKVPGLAVAAIGG